MHESSDLGPCGWPYVVVADGGNATIAGENIWSAFENKTSVGTVMLGDLKAVLPVYEVTIDSKIIRIGAGEVSNGVWVLTSNDAEIVVDNASLILGTNP